MIPAVEFKKQISRSLSAKMKAVGFKGSGFYYRKDTQAYVFVIGIQASLYGGQCCAELGIQPRELASIENDKVDLKKLKHYECELRTRLAPPNMGDYWWQYSDQEATNLQTAAEIFEVVQTQALPVVHSFEEQSHLLEQIEPADLDNMYQTLPKKLAGMRLMTTDVRFAWMLTKLWEKKNLDKAKEFAQFGLSKLDNDGLFFGKQDFERIIRINYGA